MGSWGEKVSGKLPPVSKVRDVVNGPTSEFISQFDNLLPSLSQSSQLGSLSMLMLSGEVK